MPSIGGIASGAASGAAAGGLGGPAGMVIGAGIGAAASIFGAKKSSNTALKGQREAARMEERYTQEALRDAREQRTYEQRLAEADRAYTRGRDRELFDFEREKFGIEQKNYGDERDFGRGQFANYLGRLEAFRAPANGAVANLSAVTSRALPASVPTNGGGAVVTLRAPNGAISQVPAAHVEHYLKLGATRV